MSSLYINIACEFSLPNLFESKVVILGDNVTCIKLAEY